MTLDVCSQVHNDDIINKLFGEQTKSQILPINDHFCSISSDEQEIVRHTSQKRRNEFSTGRICARNSLLAYGINNFPILRNQQREPIWPDNIVGSISHCRDLCGAVVAKKSSIRAIGFDIENVRRLRQDISKHICTQQELEWLASQSRTERDRLVILFFSLKEAIFKCISSLQNIQISFKDCAIQPDSGSNSAYVHFYLPNIQNDIKLRFYVSEQHVYSGAYFE